MRQCGHRVRVEGEQDLAQRGGVQRQERADLERLRRVVRPEDVMDHEDPAVQERADPHRLAAARRERVGPVDSPRAELVDIEIARAEVQQRGPELVLAGRLVLFDEADALQCPQDAVGRAPGQAERAGDLAHAEPSPAARQQPEDRCPPLYRLNRAWHAAHPNADGRYSTMSAFVHRFEWPMRLMSGRQGFDHDAERNTVQYS